MAQDTPTKLTAKQARFIDEYLQCWNASEAARRAGYSLKTAYAIGPENLSKPVIAAAIQERLQQSAMSADEALYRLGEHARASIADFIDPETGVVDLNRSPGKLHLIKRLTQTQTEFGMSVRIELHDAQAALVHILNESRLNTDKATSRVDVKLNLDALTDVDLARIATSGRGRTAGEA